MNQIDKFRAEVKNNIESMAKDYDLQRIKNHLYQYIVKYKYSYNFNWLGRPIVQYPQDIIAIQELIWKVKPNLIIETGIAHGGSLILSASILELIGGDGEVLGIDIDIREHNRIEIEKHPLFKRISMIQGSSIDEDIARQIYEFAKDKVHVFIILDSNHTHEHVLKELELYSPLVTKGSYLVVCDTVIEDIPDDLFPDRPWEKGNNPRTAVWEFLKSNDRFVIDKDFENKLMITSAPDGYLKCIKNKKVVIK